MQRRRANSAAVAVILGLFGLVVLAFPAYGLWWIHSYDTAPACPAGVEDPGCRYDRQGAIQDVTLDSSRSGTYYAVQVGGTGWADLIDLNPGVVSSSTFTVGEPATAEFWQNQVTTLTAGGISYRSRNLSAGPWAFFIVVSSALLLAAAAIGIRGGRRAQERPL